MEIPGHIRPFLPYVDKQSGVYELEAFAGSQSHNISLHTIKYWLRICDGSHQEHCRPAAPLSQARLRGPRWLVDVHSSCLVLTQSLRQQQRYVALSYVWGDPHSFSSLTSNIYDLQREGSLVQEDIPQTIRDAMDLVLALGERYMWIDRLCIIQDDVAMKVGELALMGAIYAQAYFTIVAAQGPDDRYPLHNGLVTDYSFLEDITCGCNGASFNPLEQPSRRGHADGSLLGATARERLGKKHRFDGFYGNHESTILNPIITSTSGVVSDFIVPRPCHRHPSANSRASKRTCMPRHSAATRHCHHQSEAWDVWKTGQYASHECIMEDQSSRLQDTRWYSRGWTFQEYLLSRRKLVFQGNTVNWECHCASWHEMQKVIHATPCAKPPLHLEVDFGGLAVELWPNLHRYCRLASIFTLRDLTYDDDALDAFAGVLSALESSFPGGFISGLPRMCFDAALLWQPHSPMRRRVSSSPLAAASATASPSVLPSWSWVGWHGEMNTESWRSGYGYMRQHDDDAGIGPPCSWITTPTLQWYYSSTSTPQADMWIPVSECESKQLGSVRENVSEGWIEHKCPRFNKPYFTHLCDTQQEFWYPIPLMQPSDASSSTLGSARPSFIRTPRTRHAQLRISRFFSNQEVSSCVTAVLMTLDGVWAGILRLNETIETNSVSEGEVCELLELSGGSVEDEAADAVSFDEWWLEECLRKSGRYEFFNVMWVEWADGIAYRKAVGRVEKAIWHLESSDIKDVVIG